MSMKYKSRIIFKLQLLRTNLYKNINIKPYTINIETVSRLNMLKYRMPQARELGKVGLSYTKERQVE